MPSTSHWPALEAFCKKHNLGFLQIRFRLRTLLFMTTLLAVVLGFVANVLIHIRRQSAITARINERSGQATFHNYFAGVSGEEVARSEWYREHFGEHAFRHIKHVHLISLQPHDEVLALLPQLSRLEALQVSGKNYTADNLRSIVRCRQLQTLHMHLSGSESASIAELSQLPKLRQLALNDFGETQIREAATLSQLEELSIRSRATTPAVLAELKKLPQLKVLEINGCVDDQHETCAALIGCERLEVLSLRNIPLKASDFQQLARLPNLRQLYMAEMSPLDVEAASALRQVTPLRKLGLSKYCTDESLAALAGMPELDALNVTGSDITDASIAVLRQFPKLRELYIAKTQLTAAGIMQLTSGLEFRQLGINRGLLSYEQEQELIRRKPQVVVRQEL